MNHDRHTAVDRFVAPDVDRHRVEVAAIAERELQVDEAVRVERLAGLDGHVPPDEARIENVLLDLDVAEEVFRAGIEDQLDVGLAFLAPHADLRLPIDGVDVARVAGRVEEPLLRGFVLRVLQLLARRKLGGRERRAHRGLFAAVADCADLDDVDDGGRAGIDVVAREPARHPCAATSSGS